MIDQMTGMVARMVGRRLCYSDLIAETGLRAGYALNSLERKWNAPQVCRQRGAKR